jgi:hypothetical protein
MKMKLSTPHGTLGTGAGVVITALMAYLSTPHGTLGTRNPHRNRNHRNHPLSTPHGTLGTPSFQSRKKEKTSFQLHTVH